WRGAAARRAPGPRGGPRVERRMARRERSRRAAGGPLGRAGAAAPRGDLGHHGPRGRRGRARRRAPLPAAAARAGVTVLVTGATALVGSHVVPALRAAGEPVRATLRAPSLGVALPRGAEPVEGDARAAAAWQRAGQGGRATVHTAPI